MNSTDLCFLSVADLGALIERREVSAVEVAQTYLTRIEELEPRLNAYVCVLGEQSLAEARKVDEAIAAGKYLGPLHGAPVALKDIFDLAGTKTTASSKILADNLVHTDSTVTRKLKAAGAVFVGKTNMHEFAFGITTNNPHYGPTRNPWDTTRVPGGSSGGSGAAVSAGLCAAATGTDTGGSIRIPAALCGTVGLKPTFGRVSKAGVLPLSWSMDHAGPLTRTVEDAAIFLAAIAGYDPSDTTSADVPVADYRAALGAGVRGMRLGVPRDFFFAQLDPDVRRAVEEAVAVFRLLGVAADDAALPHMAYAPTVVPLTIQSEAAAYHEHWLRTRPQDYGADVRRRLEVGRTALATDYINAQRVRSMIKADFDQALDLFDGLIVPTIPTVAVPIGEDRVEVDGQIFGVRPTYTRFTSPINLTGLPAISIPCGFSAGGLPIGFQLVGRAFDETTLLSLAHAYEQATEWHDRRPPIDV